MHFYQLFQKIYRDHIAIARGGFHKGTLFRHILHQIFIGFLLIAKAAHQTPAASGDFCRVQRKILDFRHFSRNRSKIIQEGMTAIRSATDTDTSQHFRFVPHTDLAQLDAVMEHTGKVLHQFTEINPAVSCEKEKCFTAVKTAFHVDELHFKPVFFNFLLADDKSFLLAKPVLFLRAFILLRCNADNRAQWFDNGGILHHAVALRTFRNFKSLRGFYYDPVSVTKDHALRRKVIALPAGFEFYANNFCQFKLLFASLQGSSRFPAARTPASH